jgi:hypothetical protein
MTAHYAFWRVLEFHESKGIKRSVVWGLIFDRANGEPDIRVFPKNEIPRWIVRMYFSELFSEVHIPEFFNTTVFPAKRIETSRVEYRRDIECGFYLLPPQRIEEGCGYDYLGKVFRHSSAHLKNSPLQNVGWF